MKKKFKNKHVFADVYGLTTLNQLAQVLAESPTQLRELVKTKNSFYEPFVQKGKNGKRDRPIDKPVGQLKLVQKKIGDRLLKLYSLSAITYGAVAKKSTRDNAMNHIGKKVVVRLDLVDCFHSIKAEWIYRCFRKRFGCSKSVSKVLTEICTYNGSIPVGSPLSSMLVNVVLDPLWNKIQAIVEITDHVVTVWVDDIIISGDEAEKLVNPVKKLVHEHGLRINWDKKKFKIMRSGQLQEATGCSLNSTVGVPKHKRAQYAKEAIARAFKGATTLEGQAGSVTYIKPAQGRQLLKLVKLINLGKNTAKATVTAQAS